MKVSPQSEHQACDDQGTISVEVIQQGYGDTPLFLIADNEGWTPFFCSIRAHLDPSVSVYRLALADCLPPRTLHRLATLLLQKILAICPSGNPVKIVGFGASAMLAYEVAIQCEALDESIGFFGILDEAFRIKKPIYGSAPLNERTARYTTLATRDYEIEPANFVVHVFTHDQQLVTTNDLVILHRRLPSSHLKNWRVDCRKSSAEPEKSFGMLLRVALNTLPHPCLQNQLSDSYEPLMTIQSGSKDCETYFCFPGAGASVMDFIPFVGAIGTSYPVYGLQARGISGDLVPHGSVEAAARCYVDAITRSCGGSEVHLIGHSFGGWIAYDVALRLQQMGRDVLSLTLLDSDAPSISTRIGSEYTRLEAIMALVSLYEQAAMQSLDIQYLELESLSSAGQLALLHRQLVRVGLLSQRVAPEHLRGTLRSFEAALRTQYRPAETFDGPLRLVLARDPMTYGEATTLREYDNVKAWHSLAPNLKFHCELGNHITLLKPPHIGNVVRWMQSIPVTAFKNTSMSTRKVAHPSRPPKSIIVPI